jgi:hypothetical protein
MMPLGETLLELMNDVALMAACVSSPVIDLAALGDTPPPPEELPDAHAYMPLELHVAGLLSTFPPYDREHPQLRLPMAREVVRAVTEYEPDDADGQSVEPPQPETRAWNGCVGECEMQQAVELPKEPKP